MIDFVKARILGINQKELENNVLLNFCTEVNTSTGEIRTKNRFNKSTTLLKNAYYNGIEFSIFPCGIIYFSGSLHKYWNDGKHNFNDFNTASLRNVLEDIEKKFNIKSHQFELRQIEIGVNIIPPIKTYDVLNGCFLHITTPFKWKYVPDEGEYIQVKHSQYKIKIYDKAKHYKKKGFDVGFNNIMRFEIKYDKLEKLKENKIFTLADLLNYGIENFTEILIGEWNKILFYDNTIKCNSRLLLQYSNPKYWTDLTSRPPAYQKHKHQYKEITKKYSQDIALQIENIIIRKCNELTT
jgi:hypothetical protein